MLKTHERVAPSPARWQAVRWAQVIIDLAVLLPLAVWTGAAVGLTFLTTPVIFAVMDRDAASRLVGALFPGYFLLALGCVTLALLAALAGAWRTPDRSRTRWLLPAVLGALLLLLLVSGLIVEPQVAAVQARIPSFLTDPDSPARQEFRRLHAVSAILNVIGMALALVAWMVTAAKRAA